MNRETKIIKKIPKIILPYKEFVINCFYAEIVKKFALRSKDPKFKVGCVIVTSSGILYPGYNGDEIGGSNVRDSLNTGESGFIHAEMNALIKFNPAIHKDCKLFVSFNPCSVCARAIVNTRSIAQVWYLEKYGNDLSGISILKKSGITCENLYLQKGKYL